MVMKDKLVKTGHHGSYYKMHRILGVASAFALILLGISITTYISIDKTVKAQEENNSSEVNESSSEEQTNNENTIGSVLSFYQNPSDLY